MVLPDVFAVCGGRIILFVVVWRRGRSGTAAYSGLASLRQESERKRQVQDLMESIEVSGGEIKPAVTHSPLPTVVALATTGEIVWANEAFAEISGQFSGARHMRMTELAPTFEARWLIEGKEEFPGRASCQGASGIPCIRQYDSKRRRTDDDALFH